jgi:hypothetical protein
MLEERGAGHFIYTVFVVGCCAGETTHARPQALRIQTCQQLIRHPRSSTIWIAFRRSYRTVVHSTKAYCERVTKLRVNTRISIGQSEKE